MTMADVEKASSLKIDHGSGDNSSDDESELLTPRVSCLYLSSCYIVPLLHIGKVLVSWKEVNDEKRE